MTKPSENLAAVRRESSGSTAAAPSAAAALAAARQPKLAPPLAAWREQLRQLSTQEWSAESDCRRAFQSSRALLPEQLEELRTAASRGTESFKDWNKKVWLDLGKVRRRVRALGHNMRFAPCRDTVERMVQGAEHELQVFVEQARLQFEELAREESSLSQSLDLALERFEGWCKQDSAACRPAQPTRKAPQARARSAGASAPSTSCSSSAPGRSRRKRGNAADEHARNLSAEERERKLSEARARQREQENAERRRSVVEWRQQRDEQRRAEEEERQQKKKEEEEALAAKQRQLQEVKRRQVEEYRRKREAEKAELLQLSSAQAAGPQHALDEEDLCRIAQRNAGLLERQQARVQARLAEEQRKQLAFEPSARRAGAGSSGASEQSSCYGHVESRVGSHTEQYVEKLRELREQEREMLSTMAAAADASRLDEVLPGNFAHQALVRPTRSCPAWRKGFGA